MSVRDRLSGNEATSIAIRQINPDVFAAFPITPSTEIPQFVSQFKARGTMSGEFVTVESEHSSISACVGASAAGVRAMTATSSAGLALMHEILYIAASCRLPIVAAVVNRALSGPININNDHSDSMGSREAGWIQLYSENAQEAYDNMLMAHRIAEDPSVKLPVMICSDGFITSHAVENVLLESDEFVRSFVGTYRPEHYLLNPNEPMSAGPYDIPAYYMEHKLLQTRAMEKAKDIVVDVGREFAAQTGRQYGLFEEYRMEDAKYAVLVMSSSAGTGKSAVDELRKKGEKAGLIKLRCFRPFPAKELAEAVKKLKALCIMDKCDSFSSCGGPIGADMRAALYANHVYIETQNLIYGLGGRDVRIDDFYEVFDDMRSGRHSDKMFSYLGSRE
ncbi:MAG: pyruvate ferredoxin oxidoreductase [Oscillospiraceae bacterium]